MAAAVDEKFFYACQKMSDWLRMVAVTVARLSDWLDCSRDPLPSRGWPRHCEATNAVDTITPPVQQQRGFRLFLCRHLMMAGLARWLLDALWNKVIVISFGTFLC